MSERTIEVGTKLLKAYALAKAGKKRSAAELFLEASASKDIDGLMNGLASSLLSIKASMEEDSLEGIEDEEYDDTEEDEDDYEEEEEADDEEVSPDFSFLETED